MGWETGSGIDTAAFEEPAKPAKPRNPRKAKVTKEAESLLAALEFVRKAVDIDAKGGVESSKFVRFTNNTLTAFDGVRLSAGFPVPEDMSACPHYARLVDAVTKARGTLSLSLSDGGRLTVAGDRLKAVVPCLPLESFPPVFPDPRVAIVDDRIRDGFAELVKLAKDDPETVQEGSVLLRANTMVATNGALALEYWHGIDLPPGLAIPQRAAKMLSALPLKMEGFGWTPGRSVTFWFEGGAWVRTQLYNEEWPDIDRVLNMESNPEEVPGLFEAIEAVADFSEDGAVHFHADKIKSTYAQSDGNGPVYGASYDLPGIVGGTRLTARLMKLAKPAVKTIDYTTHEDRVYFFNIDANLRGVLMKRL